MKVLVIGYRSGIGRAIFDSYKIDEVQGVSKSTGFDLDNSKTHNIDYSEFDTVILNAYSGFTSQLKTLYEIIDEITSRTHVIVIGSTSTFKTEPTDLYWSKYSVEKAAIFKAVTDLNTMGYNVSCVSPGTVDTSRNALKQCPKLSKDTIVNEVRRISDCFREGTLIEHSVIRTTKVWIKK